MVKMRPGKWVPWSVAGVGLPLLCAALISDPFMKAEIIEKNRLEFVKGAQERGMSEAEAQNLFIEEYLTTPKDSDDTSLEVDIYVFIK